jgi:hypothetical protein
VYLQVKYLLVYLSTEFEYLGNRPVSREENFHSWQIQYILEKLIDIQLSAG